MKSIKKSQAGEAFRRRLLSGGFASLLMKTGGSILAYAIFVVFARIMEVEAYGEFSVIFSVALFAGIVASLGTSNLLIRFISEYRAREMPGAQAGLIRATYFAVAAASVLTSAALVGWALLPGSPSSALYAASILAPAFAFSQMQAGLLRSYDVVWWSIAPFDLGWRLVTLAVIAIVVVVQIPVASWVAVGANAAALCVVVVIQTWAGRKFIPKAVRSASSMFERQRWVSAGSAIWGASVWNRATQHASVIMAGFTLSLADAAIFFAVMRTTRLLMTPLDAASVIGQPMLGRALHKNDIGEAQSICNVVSVGVTAVSAVGFLGVVIGGHWILAAFGPEFTAGYWALVALSFAVLFNAVTGPTQFVMFASGAERLHFIFLSVSSLLGLATQAVGARFLGLEGAVAGAALGQVLWNVLVWRYMRVRVGLDPTVFGTVWRVRRPPSIPSSEKETPQ